MAIQLLGLVAHSLFLELYDFGSREASSISITRQRHQCNGPGIQAWVSRRSSENLTLCPFLPSVTNQSCHLLTASCPSASLSTLLHVLLPSLLPSRSFLPASLPSLRSFPVGDFFFSFPTYLFFAGDVRPFFLLICPLFTSMQAIMQMF